MPTRSLFAERALLPEGWARDVRFEVDEEGWLVGVETAAEADDAERLGGPVLPGMPNLHSHAFQRAMAGLAERAGEGGGGQDDSFWTWRQVMYGFLQRLTPDQVEAIAAQLYVEMLKSGYTAVAEFHYLHHDPEGRPYDDPAEMALRITAAAATSGMGITVLPVLYGFGGFGGAEAGAGQRRFLNGPEALLRIVEAAGREGTANPGQVRQGLALHSLRAVTPETLKAAVEGIAVVDPDAPIHIHVAEQVKEVEDCLAWSGRRPVEWLLTEAEAAGGVDRRWCLVHATHMTETETGRLAASGAVAGLCPTTEANLGDGLFPAPDYLAADGVVGIGSDSHISVSPIEELRWLEYGQRLVSRRRNLLASATETSVGARLFRAALAGGARACGRPIGRLAPGCRADLLVLDAEAPILLGREGDTLLDSLVFSGNVNAVRDVMVGGRWLVQDFHHHAEEAVLARFRDTLAALDAVA